MLIEDVVFLDGDNACEYLDLLDEEGAEAALEKLKEWHYPREHSTRTEMPHGSSDRTFRKDGYVLSWNKGLGHIGLCFIVEDDKEAV